MITLLVQGGLGNQLFQIAFSDYVSKINNTNIYLEISKIHNVEHSNINYFDRILKRWSHLHIDILKRYNRIILETQKSWIIKRFITEKILIIGFFQTSKYIQDDFISKLNFTSSLPMLEKYPGVIDSVFLHLRGGDYINTEQGKDFDINLDNYYKKAITMFSENTKFMIFTNDKEYTNTKLFLKDITYEIIDENEIDSLFLMSKCKGGICANSTFSWWGAYLNKNRLLIIPSMWKNNLNSSQYYFEGLTVIDI